MTKSEPDALADIDGVSPCGAPLPSSLRTRIANARIDLDWDLVSRLSLEVLISTSKDLEVGAWLAEALVRQEGFRGVEQAYNLLGGLLDRFWTRGLFPLVEADDYSPRSILLNCFDTYLSNAIKDELSLSHCGDARNDVTLSLWYNAEYVKKQLESIGDVDRESLRQEYEFAPEKWDVAVKSTDARFYENLADSVERAWLALANLDKVIRRVFTRDEPDLSDSSAELSQVRSVLSSLAGRKGHRNSEDSDTGSDSSNPVPTPKATVRSPEQTPGVGLSPRATGVSIGWDEATHLAKRSLRDGLDLMNRLVSEEPCGRDRFLRKSLMADVYLEGKKSDLAKMILEELCEEIDNRKLTDWEPSSLIGSIWSRLYLCKVETGDKEGAKKLFQRLCQLAPWQAGLLGRVEYEK